jgi:LacI family transcriptional regulator
MAITLKDIGKRAGVTAATVSMVINNKPNISEQTRKRVLKISKEMEYYPNMIARGLAKKKLNSVAVIVPNLASSFVVRVLQGIKSTNRDIDYTVQLFDTIGQQEDELTLVRRLARERRIDGAILIGPTAPPDRLEEMVKGTIPCVVVAEKYANIDSLFVDHDYGAYQATAYLLERGHAGIACVIAEKNRTKTIERMKGYTRALDATGVSDPRNRYYTIEQDTMEQGARAFHEIRDITPDVTAIFVPAGDMAAIGIIKEALRMGLRVPQDIAVVGYDDIPAAEVVEPTLTTVRQPKLEMGDHAINMLIDRIEGRADAVCHKELQPKFIKRGSA